MKFEQTMDAATAAIIGVPWLAAELEPVSSYGARAFEALVPYQQGQEAQATAQAAAIAHAAAAIDAERIDTARETLRSAPDAGSAIARAGMGDALTDVHFLELQRFCDAVERVRAVLAGVSAQLPPTVAPVAALLERGRSGKFGFYLGDAFDGELASARSSLQAAQAEYDAALGRLRARIASALTREDPGGAEFIVMRDDVRGPLPPGIRVIREAPTYYLCDIELDEGALTALQKRDDAAERVAELEQLVRSGLSEGIRNHCGLLDEAARSFGSLDVFVAAVRFTQRYACNPAVYANEAVVEFDDAHFLPLQAELERQNRIYVPITLQLAGPSVVTGPNMGGKSVALRTCGFIAACASFGIPVPARRATVALFAHVDWLGIGSGTEGSLLSSFATEVVKLRDVLGARREPALLLIDEFARTTTPEEGRALLLALIARLRALNACAFIATHLSGIATDARVPAYAVRGLREIPSEPPAQDLAAALASLARSMDYTIERVTADRERTADAIFLARLLGMDEAFIQTAWQMLTNGENRKL